MCTRKPRALTEARAWYLRSLTQTDFLLRPAPDTCRISPMKLAALLTAALAAFAQTPYDLVLKGGHVVDGSTKLSAVRDVAIQNGKIAEIAASIPASRARRSVDVSGLY